MKPDNKIYILRNVDTGEVFYEINTNKNLKLETVELKEYGNARRRDKKSK